MWAKPTHPLLYSTIKSVRVFLAHFLRFSAIQMGGRVTRPKKENASAFSWRCTISQGFALKPLFSLFEKSLAKTSLWAQRNFLAFANPYTLPRGGLCYFLSLKESRGLSEQHVEQKHKTKSRQKRISCPLLCAVRVRFGYHFIAYNV